MNATRIDEETLRMMLVTLLDMVNRSSVTLVNEALNVIREGLKSPNRTFFTNQEWTATDFVRDHYDDFLETMARLYEDHPSSDAFSVQEMIKRILKALDNDGSADGNLVDFMANILKRKDCQNRLTADWLKKLRETILTPDELSKLKEESKKGFMCFSCGHVFKQGEIGIPFESRGEMVLACYRCLKPSTIACPSCTTGRRKVTVTEKTIKIQEAVCPKCMGIRDSVDEEEEVEGEEPVAVPAPQPVRGRSPLEPGRSGTFAVPANIGWEANRPIPYPTFVGETCEATQNEAPRTEGQPAPATRARTLEEVIARANRRLGRE